MRRRLLGVGLLLAACGGPPVTPDVVSGVRGAVTLPISTEHALSGQALVFREGDVTFTQLGAASVQSTAEYDYVRAQYQLTNVGPQPIANLTLVAVARSGNVGNTAIKSVTSFGGTTAGNLAAAAALTLPIHSVTVDGSGTPTLVSGAADFQAFTVTEVSALTGQPGWNALYGASDTPLNYGFVARACTGSPCVPGSSRTIAAGGSGVVNVALRIPRGSTTSYAFLMNFAIVDQDTARVTRSLVPAETAAAAAARLTSVGVTSGGEVMQVTSGPAGSSGRTDLTTPGLTLTSSGAYTQILTFGAAPGPLTAGGATGQASATSSNPTGAAVTYGTTTASVCTVSATGVITPLTAGTCVVTADQVGSTGSPAYTPAPQIRQNVTVNPGPVAVQINAADGSVRINGAALATDGTYAFQTGVTYAITLTIPASLSAATPSFGPKLTGLANLGADDSWKNVVTGLTPTREYNLYTSATSGWDCYDYKATGNGVFSGLLSYVNAPQGTATSSGYNSLTNGSGRANGLSTTPLSNSRGYQLSANQWFTSAAEWAGFNPTSSGQNLTVNCF
jgi:hypothetical protein